MKKYSTMPTDLNKRGHKLQPKKEQKKKKFSTEVYPVLERKRSLSLEDYLFPIVCSEEGRLPALVLNVSEVL